MSNWEYPVSESKKIEFNSLLSKVGWILKESEGTYYIGESGGWFENRFKSILTKPYDTYLKFRSTEIEEGFSEDAGLQISWEQLRRRIANWEAFLKKHPDFKENSEIREYLVIYIRTFLTGMDNSRIYDFDTRKLKAEAKIAYENFLRDNKTSAYYKLVKDGYEILKNNQFVVPENYGEFLNKKGYETMLGRQTPTY